MSPENKSQRIVIKLGTSTLTAGTSCLSKTHMLELVRQMAKLHTSGDEITIVTSGAIAAGRECLGFPQLFKDIPAKQMLASIGQPRLMALYEKLFDLYGMIIAQVLLTRSDLMDRRRYLNSRNTLTALHEQRAIPIVNENDTVATEEIRFGDNDNLSALVANLLEADLLILLTDQPGLFTADPRFHTDVKIVSEVIEPSIPAWLWQAAGSSQSEQGTGGMLTKLQAADLARRSGSAVVIANGAEPDVLNRLVAGEKLGTYFAPLVSSLESRKRYILAGGQSIGRLTIDDGADSALRHGSSLLPVGITTVEGEFDRGESVLIINKNRQEIGRGIVNYSSKDISHILGEQSEAIESILGYRYGEEVIHRNNMVLFI